MSGAAEREAGAAPRRRPVDPLLHARTRREHVEADLRRCRGGAVRRDCVSIPRVAACRRWPIMSAGCERLHAYRVLSAKAPGSHVRPGCNGHLLVRSRYRQLRQPRGIQLSAGGSPGVPAGPHGGGPPIATGLPQGSVECRAQRSIVMLTWRLRASRTSLAVAIGGSISPCALVTTSPAFTCIPSSACLTASTRRWDRCWL